MKLIFYPTPYIKTNSKLVKDLNIRFETIKLLVENIRDKLLDIGLGNDFFGFDTKSKGNKCKNKQVGLHQTKKLLLSIGNHQQNEKATYGNGRKYWQTTYPIRDYYPKYTRNSYN